MFWTIVLIVVAVILVLIAVVLVMAVTMPDSFRIERSAIMNAPPEKIFPHINDFHNWLPWSPWEKLDPNLKRTYGGPAAGQGTTYEWEGNKQVGKGRMEILEALPASKISIKLDFLKPFEAHHTSEFLLAPQGDSTNVTWTLLGRLPFMFKVMCVVFRFNMDKMVGKDYETGLANLKGIVEK